MATATSQLSVKDFATRIRERHPGAYDDMSDSDLTSKVLAKYPQYADMVQPAGGKKTGWEPTQVEQSYGESLMQGMKDEGDPQAHIAAGKAALVAGASALAPELLPEMAGSGFWGFLGRVLLRSGAAAGGAGVGNASGQAITGENPFAAEQAKETAKVAGWTGALALPFEAIGALPGTKIGRAVVNKSIGATGRDMTYANPARALAKEEITDVATGDWNAYQEALRDGKSPAEAAHAAGGRFAAINQRVNELTPRLGKLLNQSTAQIPVANVIDKPLEDAALDIIKNGAMGDTEKMAALTKLGELQKSMKEGLGTTATPPQLQVLKQQIGARVNWGGTSAVTDDVKQAFRNLYGSLKEAIHRSVDGSADLDNRLTDLLGAMSSIEDSAKAGESGKLPFTLTGMAETGAGKVLPGAGHGGAALRPFAVSGSATIAQQLQSKGAPNVPALPFHPGAGIPKP